MPFPAHRHPVTGKGHSPSDAVAGQTASSHLASTPVLVIVTSGPSAKEGLGAIGRERMRRRLPPRRSPPRADGGTGPSGGIAASMSPLKSANSRPPHAIGLASRVNPPMAAKVNVNSDICPAGIRTWSMLKDGTDQINRSVVQPLGLRGVTYDGGLVR